MNRYKDCVETGTLVHWASDFEHLKEHGIYMNCGAELLNPSSYLNGQFSVCRISSLPAQFACSEAFAVALIEYQIVSSTVLGIIDDSIALGYLRTIYN